MDNELAMQEFRANISKAVNLMQARVEEASLTGDSFTIFHCLMELYRLADTVKANVEEAVRQCTKF